MLRDIWGVVEDKHPTIGRVKVLDQSDHVEAVDDLISSLDDSVKVDVIIFKNNNHSETISSAANSLEILRSEILEKRHKYISRVSVPFTRSVTGGTMRHRTYANFIDEYHTVDLKLGTRLPNHREEPSYLAAKVSYHVKQAGNPLVRHLANAPIARSVASSILFSK